MRAIVRLLHHLPWWLAAAAIVTLLLGGAACRRLMSVVAQGRSPAQITQTPQTAVQPGVGVREVLPCPVRDDLVALSLPGSYTRDDLSLVRVYRKSGQGWLLEWEKPGVWPQWSPDGRRICLTFPGRHWSRQVWERSDDQRGYWRKVFEIEEPRTIFCAWSADSSMLALLGLDVLAVWNVRDVRRLHLEVHPSSRYRSYPIVWHPSLPRVYFLMRSKSGYVPAYLDFGTGQTTPLQVEARGNGFNSLALSPTGDRIYLFSYTEGQFSEYQLDGPGPLRELRRVPRDLKLRSPAFSPDGRWLAGMDGWKTLWVVPLAGGEPQRVHAPIAGPMAFGPNETLFFVCRAEAEDTIWAARREGGKWNASAIFTVTRTPQEPRPNLARLSTFAVSPASEGEMIVGLSDLPGTLFRMYRKSGSRWLSEWQLTGPKELGAAVRWSPDGSRICLTLGWNSRWQIWERTGIFRRWRKTYEFTEPVGNLCRWSPDGKRLAFVGPWPNGLWVWDADSREWVVQWQPEHGELPAWALEWDPSGPRVYFLTPPEGESPQPAYLDLSTRQVTRIDLGGEGFNSLTLSPQGDRMYLSRAGEVFQHELDGSKGLRQVTKAPPYFLTGELSPDGRWWAALDRAEALWLVPISGGTPERVHEGPVDVLDFGGKGTLFFSTTTFPESDSKPEIWMWSARLDDGQWRSQKLLQVEPAFHGQIESQSGGIEERWVPPANGHSPTQ